LAGLPDRKKTVAKLTSKNSQTQQKQPKLAKNNQTSGNCYVFTKTLIFSLEISRLQLYLSPCILPENA